MPCEGSLLMIEQNQSLSITEGIKARRAIAQFQPELVPRTVIEEILGY